MACVQTYFCGPGVLAKAIKEATLEHTCSTVEFSFAKVSRLLSPSCLDFDRHPRNISECSAFNLYTWEGGVVVFALLLLLLLLLWPIRACKVTFKTEHILSVVFCGRYKSVVVCNFEML